MKDAYTFDLTAEAGRHAYNKMFVAYLARSPAWG